MADKLALKQNLRHASQSIVITRQNLIAVCSLCIKSILDKACFQVVDECSLDLQNFLNIIETIFFFQFKGNIDSKRNPYSVLRFCAGKSTVNLFHTIESLDKLNHFIGRFRGAIRLALMNKCLYQLLETLLAKRSVMELHYFEDSVFRCPDAAALVSQLAGLDALDLSFDLRCPRLLEQLCYPRTCPINYAAHMQLLVLDEAKLDDQIELAADAGSNEAAALMSASPEPSGFSETPLPDCPHCDWRARYLRAEAQLKRTAEQKSYLEELNKRMTDEREAAALASDAAQAEYAKEIKLYENVVLELQVQLTLLQEQYNRRLAAGNSGSGPPAAVHAGDGVTRPRLPQLNRQDSDPLPRVSVNDETCEIEAQEFDEGTVAYRAPASALEANQSASEAFSYTEVERRLLEESVSTLADASSAATLTSAMSRTPAAAASASAESDNSINNRQNESSNDSSDLVKVDSVCDSAEIVSSNSEADDESASPAAHLLADPTYYSLMPAVSAGQSESPADADSASAAAT